MTCYNGIKGGEVKRSKELCFLTKIVRQAGELINDDLKIKAKDDHGDLVTNFDYAIEKFLISEIRREYPDFVIVSEEYNSDIKMAENCFVIDPVDGTINFAHGLPLWGIQVACVKAGKTCAAVVYLPALNEFYEADESGVYLNEEVISVNNYGLAQGLCDIEGTNKRELLPTAFRSFRHIRNLNSSAVVFAWTAAGKLSAGLYFGKDKPWDYIPGQYLVERAGGVVYNEEGVHIAANGVEWSEVLKEMTS